MFTLWSWRCFKSNYEYITIYLQQKTCRQFPMFSGLGRLEGVWWDKELRNTNISLTFPGYTCWARRFLKLTLWSWCLGIFCFRWFFFHFELNFLWKCWEKPKQSKCKHSKSPCSVVFESLSVSCRYTIYFQGQDWFGWWGSKIKQKAKLVVPAMAYRDWTQQQ